MLLGGYVGQTQVHFGERALRLPAKNAPEATVRVVRRFNEERKAGESFRGWMDRYGLFALFALAAIPNPFFDVAGIIAGVSHIKVTTYLAVTWAGKIVKFILIALLGAGSVDLLESFD